MAASVPIETSNIGDGLEGRGQLSSGFATPVQLARNNPDYGNFVFMSDRFHDPRERHDGHGAETGTFPVPARRDLETTSRTAESATFSLAARTLSVAPSSDAVTFCGFRNRP